MFYILALYFSCLSNRLKTIAKYGFYAGLLVYCLGALSLISSTIPSYFTQAMDVLHYSKVTMIISLLVLLVPSSTTVYSWLAVKFGDGLIKNGLLAKFVKYTKLKLSLTDLDKSLYESLVTDGVKKTLYWLIYLWDLFTTYKTVIVSIFWVCVAYASFLTAASFYVSFINHGVYYAAYATGGFKYLLVILGYFIIKAIFIPDAKTIQLIALTWISSYLYNNSGLTNLKTYLDGKIDNLKTEVITS